MTERLEENVLFIAATRPALVAGVPLPIAGAMLMLCGFIIVLAQNPLYELVMVPIWFGARVVVARDYNAVNVVYLWLRTAARAIDGAIWGGATVSPNPIKVSARGRGIV